MVDIADDVVASLAELRRSTNWSNGAQYDLPAGAILFVVSPVDRRLQSGIQLSFNVPKRSVLHFDSLRFEAFSEQWSHPVYACPTKAAESGVASADLLQRLLESHELTPTGAKAAWFDLIVFDAEKLGNHFIVRMPSISVNGERARIPDLWFKKSPVRNGYALCMPES